MNNPMSVARSLVSSILVLLFVFFALGQTADKKAEPLGYPIHLNTDLISAEGDLDTLSAMFEKIGGQRSLTTIEHPRKLEAHVDPQLTVKQAVPVLCVASNWAIPFSLYTDIEIPWKVVAKMPLNPDPNRLTLNIGGFEERKKQGGEYFYFPRGQVTIGFRIYSFDNAVTASTEKDIIIAAESPDQYQVAFEKVDLEKVILKLRPALLKLAKNRRVIKVFIEGDPSKVKFGAVGKVADLIAKHNLSAELDLYLFDPTGAEPCR